MIQLLYIDLFCGAGGTSTGVNEARLHGEQCAKVIACVNHDPKAIASHAANHPGALHFTEDIRTLSLTPLIQRIKACRHENPQALIVLWASLECTNFSRAKGGQPRDADSRTLAEHLYRYIEAIDPDFIQIENVEEFMSWGPLDFAIGRNLIGLTPVELVKAGTAGNDYKLLEKIGGYDLTSTYGKLLADNANLITGGASGVTYNESTETLTIATTGSVVPALKAPSALFEAGIDGIEQV